METEGRLGWRFLSLADLRGRILLDGEGRRLGTVTAAVTRLGGGVDLLVPKDIPRGRVLRVALDHVEIEEAGNLWRRIPRRLYRIAVTAPTAGSLSER